MMEYNDFLRSIGLKISYYRKIKGLTQENLADLVKISHHYMGQIEAPNVFKAPSLQTLLQIANALEVPVYKLLKFD